MSSTKKAAKKSKPPAAWRQQAGHEGGSRQTAKQVAAREAMQAARAGVPVHPLPAAVRAALATILGLISGPGGDPKPRPAKASELAKLRGVSTRSVLRWLRGELHPDPRHHVAIRGYAVRCERRAYEQQKR